jgi:phosphate/sulfate permease
MLSPTAWLLLIGGALIMILALGWKKAKGDRIFALLLGFSHFTLGLWIAFQEDYPLGFILPLIGFIIAIGYLFVYKFYWRRRNVFKNMMEENQ